MIRSYLHATYSDQMDFTGKDLVSLTDKPKETVRALIPHLKDAREMKRRWTLTRKLRTFNTGEIADEVHEFLDATMGRFRLKRISLKRGRVIELSLKPGTG
jgi:hypothetical protein